MNQSIFWLGFLRGPLSPILWTLNLEILLNIGHSCQLWRSSNQLVSTKHPSLIHVVKQPLNYPTPTPKDFRNTDLRGLRHQGRNSEAETLRSKLQRLRLTLSLKIQRLRLWGRDSESKTSKDETYCKVETSNAKTYSEAETSKVKTYLDVETPRLKLQRTRLTPKPKLQSMRLTPRLKLQRPRLTLMPRLPTPRISLTPNTSKEVGIIWRFYPTSNSDWNRKDSIQSLNFLKGVSIDWNY